LEADRAARLDMSLGLGGADDVVEAAVIEIERQPEPRIGGQRAGGQLGIEQEIVRIGDCIDVTVEGCRATTAVEPARLDPGKLRQCENKLRLRVTSGG